MPLVTSKLTIHLRIHNMDAIERQEAELKKRLENVDTLDERREIRRQLRDLRKQAEQLESKKDVNANIVTEDSKKETKEVKKEENTKGNKSTEDDAVTVTAEERRRRREARLNEKNKEAGVESTEKKQEELKERTRSTENAVEDKKQEKEREEPEKRRERRERRSAEKSVEKSVEPEKKAETKSEEKVEKKSEEKVEEKTEEKSESKPEEKAEKKLRSTSEEKEERKPESTPKEKSEEKSREKSEEKVTEKAGKGEEVSSESKDRRSASVEKESGDTSKMNGPMRSASLRTKDDRSTRPSLYGDKQKAKGTIGKALSVSQMKDKFGQGGPSKPVELGTSFFKKTDKVAEPVKPPSTTSKLRETNTSESYRREVPKPKQHHKTAPAGIIPPTAEDPPKPSVPGLGGSAADRLAFFRQAAEAEKARKEKQAERERLMSAPADIPSDTKENRSAPCKKKMDNKRTLKRTKSISSIVLDWCKEMVREYGIEIKNFSSSWNDGYAFCALVHRFEKDAFDFNELKRENRGENFKLAFETANQRKNIPILLDVEDMVRMKNPEPRSVQCYIQWMWRVYGPTSGCYNEEEIKAAQVA